MKLLIYGISNQAMQLYYYIKRETNYEIEAFFVDKGYKKTDFINNVPVLDTDDVIKQFNPNDYQIVLSFGYKNMMNNRKQKFEFCKENGFTLFTFISKYAHVYTSEIGEGTIIYPNVTIAPNTKVGKGNFFEISTTIAHDVIIGDFNFFAPNATISGCTKIKDNCFFGISSIIYNNLLVDSYTLVGAGAILNHNSNFGEAYKSIETVLLNKKSNEYI